VSLPARPLSKLAPKMRTPPRVRKGARVRGFGLPSAVSLYRSKFSECPAGAVVHNRI
jgi:hypothetical protein